MPTIENDDYLK